MPSRGPEIALPIRYAIATCRLLFGSTYDEIERKTGVPACTAGAMMRRAIDRAGGEDFHAVLRCMEVMERPGRTPRVSIQGCEERVGAAGENTAAAAAAADAGRSVAEDNGGAAVGTAQAQESFSRRRKVPNVQRSAGSQRPRPAQRVEKVAPRSETAKRWPKGRDVVGAPRFPRSRRLGVKKKNEGDKKKIPGDMLNTFRF